MLPQALRNVIPAQIGQLISLFKDTTLAGAAMGLFDLLAVSEAITQQGEFRGQGLIGETMPFAALLFWTVSYTMSRESQRLERKTGSRDDDERSDHRPRAGRSSPTPPRWPAPAR